MTINEKLKQKIDEFDIDKHVNDLVIQAESALANARVKAGELASERGEDVERLVERVATTLDARTQGRFAEPIGKVRAQVSAGVARLAEQRRTDDDSV